jgi:hypothetical protein
MSHFINQTRIYSLPWRTRHALLRELDRVAEFRSAGVSLVGPGLNRVLRRSQNGLHVVVELQTAPVPRPGQSEDLWGEVLEMGVYFGATVSLAKASIFTATTVPATWGRTAPVAKAALVGAYSTGAQCIVSVSRVATVVFRPGALEQMDKDVLYKMGRPVLDVGSPISGVRSLLQGFRIAKSVISAGSGSLRQLSKPMSRAARRSFGKRAADAKRVRERIPRKEYRRQLRTGVIRRTVRQHEIAPLLRYARWNSAAAGISMVGSASHGVIRAVVLHLIQVVEQQETAK